ncbi:MAG: hypothetical protein Pg6C_11660 [Treponemataceae bacterium]|nr:MAG: hypothetical protein Pg6C_11660 [Treponemataceae bacterium]
MTKVELWQSSTRVWEQAGLSIAANGGSRSFTGVPEGVYIAHVIIEGIPGSLPAFNTRIEAGKTTTVTVTGEGGPDTTCTAGAPQ